MNNFVNGVAVTCIAFLILKDAKEALYKKIDQRLAEDGIIENKIVTITKDDNGVRYFRFH